MSSNLDLRLPYQVARLRTPPGHKRFAIYSMAGLDQRELRNLRHDINSAEFVNEACELSPRASFAGMSLGAVLDYHLTLRVRDSRFHPLLFIVATHRNWQDYGVIFVHLDFDEQGSIGHARCAIDQAASYCMNMDIGNMSWDEVKDEEMFEWPAYFRMPKSVPTTGLTPRKQFGIYCFHPELWVVQPHLDPTWKGKEASQLRFFPATTLTAPHEPGDASRQWSQLAHEHVSCCMTFPGLDREWCIVVEHGNFAASNAVAIVRFRWVQDSDAPIMSNTPDPRWEIIRRTFAVRAIMEIQNLIITPPSTVGDG